MPLYNILKTGRIRAGLDVWYNYPANEYSRTATQPSSYPFSELDNVVMTPHLAGNNENESRRLKDLADLLNKIAAGKKIPNKVDIKAGY